MKKIILALMLLIFLGACNKEEVKPTTKESHQKSEKTLKLIAQLTDVKNRIESRGNDNSRDADDLTIEEGVEGIENLLNVYFVKSNTLYGEYDISEFDFDVPVSNGFISDAELSAAYYLAWQNMKDHYINTNWSDKGVSNIRVEIMSVDNDIVHLNTINTIGKELLPDADLTGECDNADIVFTQPYSFYDVIFCPSNQEIDAPDAFTIAINQNMPSPPIPVGIAVNNYTLSYINEYDITHQALEFPRPGADLNICDTRNFLMAVDCQELGPCIAADDMNWFYCNMINIIQSDEDIPNNNYFKHVDVFANYPTGGGPSYGWHGIYTIYGTPVFVNNTKYPGGDDPFGGIDIDTDVFTP